MDLIGYSNKLILVFCSNLPLPLTKKQMLAGPALINKFGVIAKTYGFLIIGHSEL